MQGGMARGKPGKAVGGSPSGTSMVFVFVG